MAQSEIESVKMANNESLLGILGGCASGFCLGNAPELTKAFRVITGKEKADVAINKILENEGKNFGFNAATGKYVADMIKAGIIDPLKVTRTALENAVSVAAMLLTTEVAIADKPEKKENPMPPMSGMEGMM